jgi:biopolymer transport protein ExbD
MPRQDKRQRLGEGGKDVGFDLTPMIDIVFQLIIFFMVSLAFAESQAEARLILPAADMAKPPDAVEKDMFTFNVVDLLARGPNGNLIFAGKPPYVVNGVYVSGEELLKRLKDEAELSRSESQDGKVQRGIIIRGDKDAAWAYILAAMKLCQEAGFTKVYLKAMEKPLAEQVKEELKNASGSGN